MNINFDNSFNSFWAIKWRFLYAFTLNEADINNPTAENIAIGSEDSKKYPAAIPTNIPQSQKINDKNQAFLNVILI